MRSGGACVGGAVAVGGVLAAGIVGRRPDRGRGGGPLGPLGRPAAAAPSPSRRVVVCPAHAGLPGGERCPLSGRARVGGSAGQAGACRGRVVATGGWVPCVPQLYCGAQTPMAAPKHRGRFSAYPGVLCLGEPPCARQRPKVTREGVPVDCGPGVSTPCTGARTIISSARGSCRRRSARRRGVPVDIGVI